MVKLVSKLYSPSDLLDAINCLELVLQKDWKEAKDIVIELRKRGYKLVKVDNEQRDKT